MLILSTSVRGFVFILDRALIGGIAIIENSGHDLNLHLTAPMFFRAVVAWLGSKGF